MLGPFVELLEVVGGVVVMQAPVEAEPADVVLDRDRVLDVFLQRVRVVEAEVAAPAILVGDAEVEADRLGVADVEVAVGLGRKAREDLAAVLPGAAVLLDDVADEVGAGGLAGHRLNLPTVELARSPDRAVQDGGVIPSWSKRKAS